jgi:hypothetical protein
VAGNYAEAAVAYYNAITTANGANSFFPTGTSSVTWMDAAVGMGLAIRGSATSRMSDSLLQESFSR